MYIEALTNTYTQPVNQAANQRVEMPKTAETSKAESTDGGVNVSIAKEADESVTLSIMADERLVDEQKNVDMDRLKKVMEQVTSAWPHSAAKFGIHEKTNRITIKLVDKETQKVIKEIPPERTLDLLAKRMELAGVMVDAKL
ncbi:MAG: flagellar protein FlaG [Lachnospiraceae bacterium]